LSSRAELEALPDGELLAELRRLDRGSAGREEICGILVSRYAGLVRSCVSPYRRSPEPVDDLVQVGYVGLLKAINNFDPEYGASLGAYAAPCISGEIKRYFRDRRWQVRVSRQSQELRLGMRVADRFGDSGITGLAIIDQTSPDVWIVRDFLLSCRVLGRTVENAFLSWLIARAASAGVHRVVFQFVSTGRNQVALGFLRETRALESGDGTAWTFEVKLPELIPAHYVEIDDAQVS